MASAVIVMFWPDAATGPSGMPESLFAGEILLDFFFEDRGDCVLAGCAMPLHAGKTYRDGHVSIEDVPRINKTIFVIHIAEDTTKANFSEASQFFPSLFTHHDTRALRARWRA
jgi:hypothetical protein